MKTIMIGDYCFAVQKSSDSKWAIKGKILPWACFIPMKHGASLKIGPYMFGIMRGIK